MNTVVRKGRPGAGAGALVLTTQLLLGCGSHSHEVALDSGGVETGDSGEQTGDGGQRSCTPTDPAKGDGVSRSVTFAFSVAGGGKAWLVTSGEWCSPFSIKGLELSAPYTATCEGPPPPNA
jgi:hypothetical protein